MKTILIHLIKTYRFLLSPWVGQHCRFHPTCSKYGLIALERFGIVYGCYLIARRIIRCHPFCNGGIDNVPEKLGNRNG
ncbi:MAG: membrane protein insertion efficiency factor YidD [Pseudomonadota bacterium]|nr:membrane protein insertion efficiency factor YidD [Pseudomonadota bacterium]